LANSYIDQAQGVDAGRVRAWVVGLGLTSVLMIGAGLMMATLIDGPAKPWGGLALLVGAFLAAIVGLSKTSSA
jgi:hypothetical protein